MIPFETINRAALVAFPQLLRERFPNGKQQGHEYVLGSLQGQAGGSLSINLDTGVWRDFATNEGGGDPISLFAAADHHGSQSAAARVLGSRLGIYLNGDSSPSRPQARPEPDTWQPMIPPPPDAPRPSEAELRCDSLHEYPDSADRILFYVRRFEARDGRRKLFLPLVYGALNGELGWHARHPAGPRPLYGLNRLSTMPDAPVLVCEGEKSADAAQRLFPDHACVTWPGGSNAPDKADWSPLAGRSVTVWPDADEAGAKAADTVARHVPQALVLRVDELPAGFDAADLEYDCEDPAAWLRERLPVREPPRRSFRVLSEAQCEAIEPRPYVIKGLISEGDHAVLVGHPGSGKSVLAPHLAYAVAQGREVLGKRVRPGPVLYLAAEDGHGMTTRVRALRRRWGAAPNFHMIPEALDLLRPDSPQLTELVELVEELKPVLIVIDTLGRSFPGLRENDPDEGGMGRVNRVTRELASICGSAVLNLTHPAKDAGSNPTPRGHGSLNGDADVTLLVEGSRGDVRTVRLGKNRSGPSDASFAFNVAIETLGTDADGDPITAPIAEETELLPADRKKEARLRDKPAVLLRELRNLVAERGEAAVPEPGMPAVICVARGMLRKHLIGRSWFPEGVLRIASQGDPELMRSGYATENHALTTLKRNGFLAFTRNLVWLLT